MAYVVLTEQQEAYVESLIATGLYGDDVSAVMEALVMEGLRSAVERGFISLPSQEAEAANPGLETADGKLLAEPPPCPICRGGYLPAGMTVCTACGSDGIPF